MVPVQALIKSIDCYSSLKGYFTSLTALLDLNAAANTRLDTQGDVSWCSLDSHPLCASCVCAVQKSPMCSLMQFVHLLLL